MMYIKSVLTGQVYMTDSMPKFAGWEVVSRQTYVDWCNANHLPVEAE